MSNTSARRAATALENWSGASTVSASNAGVNTANTMTYTIAAQGAGKKIRLWKMSGPAGTGAASTAVITFESPAATVVGRIAAALTITAAWEVPLVASVQPAHGRIPLAVSGTNAALVLVFVSTSLTAMISELMYDVVEVHS